MEGGISKWSKFKFWVRWLMIVMLHGLVAILGFPLFPLAYYLRHKHGMEGRKNPLWFLLNYTEDNDWGLSHYKDNPPERTFWNALKWYVRNSAWNFKILFKPKWKAGEVDAFEQVKYTLPEGHNRFTRANKDLGIYGVNHCYYVIDGTTYGRYSFAQERGFVEEFNIGVSGNRYLLKIKIDMRDLIIKTFALYHYAKIFGKVRTAMRAIAPTIIMFCIAGLYTISHDYGFGWLDWVLWGLVAFVVWLGFPLLGVGYFGLYPVKYSELEDWEQRHQYINKPFGSRTDYVPSSYERTILESKFDELQYGENHKVFIYLLPWIVLLASGIIAYFLLG